MKLPRLRVLLFPLLAVPSVGVILAAALETRAQEAVPPVRARGALVRFSAGGSIDVRADRLVALEVAVGESPSALLPPGPFDAEWTAELELPLRSDATFRFSGSGSARLFVNDVEVLAEPGPVLGTAASARVRLNKGGNRIRVVYTSADDGSARFALDWEGRGFGREPLPPDALSHDPAAAGLPDAALLREGRKLVAELHCLRCHTAGDLAAASAMPELADSPPVLASVAGKFRPDWLAAWIADPRALRPDARMPQLPLTAQQVADITAYLSAGAAPAAPPPSEPALISRGAHLYADLRCAGCHSLPGASPDDSARVSLAQVGAKYLPDALAAYLRDPADSFPETRMPDFSLSETDARALAAFLIAQEGTPRLPAALGGEIARGQELFVGQGCLNCHAPAGPLAAPDLATIVAGGWNSGCVAESPTARGRAPNFALTERQRAALKSFASRGTAALTHDAPVEFAARQWENLRCAACHERDGAMPVFAGLSTEIAALDAAHPGRVLPSGEEASVDNDPPSLTWAGEKLRPEWTRQLLAGELAYRPRPWLSARMPAFRSRAEPLARGIAAIHGVPSVTPEPPPATVEQLEAGRRLVAAEAFNCVSCHAVGDTGATAPFGAPGINFAHVGERLRPEYFARWMNDPPRLAPGTKMPKFTDAAGRSLNADVLDGDTAAQWQALFSYLRSLQNSTTPP